MERKLSSIQRVWVTGKSHVITVPKNIRKILNIKDGDNVVVDWGEVIKVEIKDLPKIESKLPKFEEEVN